MSESTRSTGVADPLYGDPFVDVDEWRDEPVRHRYVHGGFEGTDCRFSMYFPDPRRYEGRFFQPMAVVPGSEHAVTEGLYVGVLPFAIDSGAYVVECNLGRFRRAFRGEDSSIAGYRASAAVATYSRTLAAEMYGEHRPFGYVFGGSGAAYRTFACIENAPGVWDGAVPYIHGTPNSIPSMFSVQSHTFRVLGPKLGQIVDAVEPGGSGDMYAGLDAEEREALAEATRLGFPVRAWFDWVRISLQYTTVWAGLFDHMVTWDPGYFDDFWTVPGYLGASPTESLLRAQVQHKTKVVKPIMVPEAKSLGLPLPLAMMGQHIDDVPVAYLLDEVPDGDLTGAMLSFVSGRAEGHNVYVSGLRDRYLSTGIGQEHFDVLRGVAEDDEVLVDNTRYLAFQTYHRHQVPGPDYDGWEQFCAGGRPIYPQRPQLLGPRYVRNNGATLQSGRFAGKMIVVQCLLDEAAYPLQAAFYQRRAREALGPGLDDHYRVWFVDNAMHMAPGQMPTVAIRPARLTRIVDYRGVLEQALRDLAAWVEAGVAPPASTDYEVVDGQIVVPAAAAERQGIQPVVTLTADGGSRAEVAVGEAVELSAEIEVPPGTGTIVAAAWDFDGTGDFSVVVPFDNESSSYESMTVHATHEFGEPGTYFPALRVISQRNARLDDPHCRVANLGRVRVVVG